MGEEYLIQWIGLNVAKRTMNPALYDELSFSWKKDIANLILQHNIPEERILNLDQTPPGFTSASKVTFAPMGAKKVPVEYRRQTSNHWNIYCFNKNAIFCQSN